MKIIISAQIDIDAASRNEALQSCQKWIDGALAQKGCLHYSWSADLNNPTRINVYEEWESEADLQAHFQGPEYIGMLTHMGQFKMLGSSAHKFAVSAEAEVYGADGKPTAAFDL